MGLSKQRGGSHPELPDSSTPCRTLSDRRPTHFAAGPGNLAPPSWAATLWGGQWFDGCQFQSDTLQVYKGQLQGGSLLLGAGLRGG